MLSTAGYVAYLFIQKNILQRAAFFLLVTSFLCHSATIGYAFVKSGHFPIHNLHETLSIVGWTITGVFLIFQYKYHLKILGVYAAPLATLIMVVVSYLPNEPVQAKAIFDS